MPEISYSPEYFRWLESHAANYYSQFGEDGVIAAIFDKIGVTHSYCVEIGAADGLFMSNTRHLIEQGWSSLQIEADPKAGMSLQDRYADNPKVKTVIAHANLIVPPTLEDLLREAGAPVDFDLLSLDVDGKDYYIWLGLARYHPRVVIAEYDPDVDVDFLPARNETGQAGLRPMQHVAVSRGYWPIARTSTNLICVRKDLTESLISLNL